MEWHLHKDASLNIKDIFDRTRLTWLQISNIAQQGAPHEVSRINGDLGIRNPEDGHGTHHIR